MINSPPLPPQALSLVTDYFVGLQQSLCNELESLDGAAKFLQDRWERELGGGGISAVLTNGAIFNKAAVNFSCIYGDKLPTSATEHNQALAGRKFTALGVSLILHPDNPYIPMAHANVRFFIAEKDGEPPLWWFGGGFDLTPYYGFIEDCKHWHQMAANACEPFGSSLYVEFKAWADRYFYLPHRNEARGVGGLFFDTYNRHDFAHSFGLMQSIGNHFIKAYAPIVERRKHMPFGTREKDFQRYRRGRYVEFNLIYDRGTSFGLQSGGRTESILLSLPPEVTWDYNWQPAANSKESALYTDFLPIRDWLNFE